MNDKEFIRPFPALTSAERYHLDVYGYVVVKNTLSSQEIGRLLEAMYRLKKDLLKSNDNNLRGCRLSANQAHHLHFAHILESEPAIFDYLTHPRLVGMAEELVGGAVRLEESEAVMNYRNPDYKPEDTIKYGFHIGTVPDVGTYSDQGLYHCTFVKTLTNLTDLGPDDGGTVVIAGSHKIQCPREDIIACAYEDPTLIHQVVAPAGSTLLFGEALIHATGQNRSDRERVIVIGGYTPTMFQAWNGQEASSEFINKTPDHLKPLISGSDKWQWQRQTRTLEMPVKPMED
jgi:ectoine hydroxylase-related dioxygenase (phytanoyl-CoA dioxygenase family)